MQTPGQLCCVAKRPTKIDEKMNKKIFSHLFTLLNAGNSVMVSEFIVQMSTNIFAFICQILNDKFVQKLTKS